MPAVRATASNVTIFFELVSFVVDLMPATRSKALKGKSLSTKRVCPTCMANNELNLAKQVYTCSVHNDHGPFTLANTGTAFEVDGVLRERTEEQIEALAETDGDRTKVVLSVHPAVEVEAHTMPSGNIYRLRPRSNPGGYGLVRELVGEPELAFVGEVTNKGATKLYRLVRRGDALLFTELVRPEEFRVEEPVDVSFDPAHLPIGQMLARTKLMPFDPAEFADRRKARVEALADQLRVCEPAVEPGSAAQVADLLMEQLRRSIEANAA